MRLDLLLVSQGIYATRAKAVAAINAGLVRVNGDLAKKASQNVNDDVKIDCDALPYLSGRGSLKLAKALEVFQIDPAGQICLDVGSSTGGFTEVLLNHGAKHVIAVDVGTDQMIPQLRQDVRVYVHEQTDIRDMQPVENTELIVIDVSFVSLGNIVDSLAKWNAPTVIALIKPQFEVSREIAARQHGVIKSESDRMNAIENVKNAFKSIGYKNHGLIESPIKGGSGNIEYLALFCKV